MAGAEMARAVAEAGGEVVVFEQNRRPFGKIEDGLPRWHDALRDKEYRRIREGLDHPRVHYVPLTTVGRDVDFADLVTEWGFSGVVLASGAWRDRPLPVEGAEAYVGRGLVYQNPFIIWFNHMDEPDYDGPAFEIRDGVIVIGGGLASIDVAKVLMIECTRRALGQRGIEESVIEIELKGIPAILARHGLAWEELDLRGCTLVYRRAIEDMPVMELPEGADDRVTAKVRAGRRKIVDKARSKFLFAVEAQATPVGLVIEDDALVGLEFARTRVEDGRVVTTDETFVRRAPFVVSSIGSLPVPIAGIPMRGELFDFLDWELGRLRGFPTVFSIGNVATGKGNIVASRKHARAVAGFVVEAFLGLGEGGHAGEEALSEPIHAEAAERARAIRAEIARQPPIAAEALDRIRGRVAARQAAVGFDGDLGAWLA